MVGLGFALQVFQLFGMNLTRRFTSLTKVNYCLISQKISRINRLSRKVRETYEPFANRLVRVGQCQEIRYWVFGDSGQVD